MNTDTLELKQGRYHNWGWPAIPPQYCEVVYAVGRTEHLWCVYTGITHGRTSTINAAEYIIIDIAQRERINLRDAMFYDLQTHIMYDRHQPGRFELDEVWFCLRRGKLRATNFIKFPCPAIIFEAFRLYIGEGWRHQVSSLDQERCQAELDSGKFNIYDPDDAFEKGFMPLGVIGEFPSAVDSRDQEAARRHPGVDYIVVDNNEYPQLIAQFGARFCCWYRERGNKEGEE